MVRREQYTDNLIFDFLYDGKSCHSKNQDFQADVN